MVDFVDNTTTSLDSVPKRTPLVLLWAFSTLVWSIFTPPHYTFAARVLILQPLWGIRMHVDDATWVQDLVLFLALHAVYSHRIGAWHFLTRNDFWWLDFGNPVLLLYIEVFALLGACGALAGGIVFRERHLRAIEQDGLAVGDRIDEQLLPPLLIPGRTSHSRLFPKKHAFSYSYLFVGVPIGVHGKISNALSVDTNRRSWFHVDGSDYLARGDRGLGLGEKLKRYLHTQDVTDREYSFAYLVTAPRFLGYSFNPVSFWYLYDSDTQLQFIILEVNNTFDERRMYLLRVNPSRGESLSDPAKNGDLVATKSFVSADPWQKDFHVSPFNSRKGSYSLRALDPLAAYEKTGQVQIDNTIVLRSSKEHAKIVARVWSEGYPADASAISALYLTKFIALWWWVGFLTFPRIVWQAQKLFLRRSLHVWLRPEVAETSMGRSFTNDERLLESIFRNWLVCVMGSCQQPIRLIYKPPHHDDEDVVVYSPGMTYEEAHHRSITLKVLSPAFYSRFVHYTNAQEAFDKECFATDDKSRTLAITGIQLLPVLLQTIEDYRTSTAAHAQGQPRFVSETWRWTLLEGLRCPPPAATYTVTSHSENQASGITSPSVSDLDIFVRTTHTDERAYRRVATKIFLSQRMALGMPPLIVLLDLSVRAMMLLVAMIYCHSLDSGDVFRPRRQGIEDLLAFLGAVALSNTVHAWAFVKG